jgi:O-antigen/teichoic acid export membrane protein
MGLYSFYISIFSILTILSGFGLTENATKFFIEYKSKVLLKIFVLIKIVLVSLFLLIAFFEIFNQNIYFTMGAIISSFSLSTQYLEAKAKGKIVLKINTLSLLFFSLVKIYGVINNSTLDFFCSVFFFETLVNCFFISLVAFSIDEDVEISLISFFNKANVLQLLNVWGASAISILYIKIDQIFVANLLSENELGVYMFASRIVEYGMLIPSMIISSMMGYLYFISNKQRETIYNLTFYIGLIISIVMIIGAYFICNYVLIKYQESFYLILIMAFGIPFSMLRIVTGKFLILDNQGRYFILRSVVLLSTNLLACQILVSSLGGVGAALAIFITFFFSGIFLDFIFKGTRKYFFIKLQSIFKIVKIYEVKALAGNHSNGNKE